MKKIPNCSTWNKIKSVFFRVAFCVAFSFSLAFSPLRSALAAPAVVPVTGGLVAELLVALGLMTHDSATDLYNWDWRTDTSLGQQYYTTDIFGNIVPKLTTGVGVTADELSPLLGTVIPENLYTTDGNDFFVNGQKVTTSDLYFLASSLVGSYGMPVNISGAQYTIGSFSGGLTGNQKFGICLTPSSSENGKGYYYFPFISTDTGSFVFTGSYTVNSDTSGSAYNFITKKSGSFLIQGGLRKYIYYPLGDNTAGYFISNTLSSAGSPDGVNFAPMIDGVFQRVSGTGDYTYSSDNLHCLLRTSDLPIFEIGADTAKLEGAVVQLKVDKDDDDNNSNMPPVPQPPSNWEIWQTLEALVDQVETGKPTNGGTTFGQYVNNNYNYVDVDINVPDEIDTNVNLSGGLDINGNGDLNITIHEDVSLPSADDGSGFFTPSATNVIGAIAKDNPVIGTLSSLFSALDPALVGIVSVSISLLLVLGLWKLIRG